MPLFFLVVGVAFLVSALHGTQGTLIQLLKGDVAGTAGKPGFVVWAGAIFLVAAIGYVRALKPISNGLLVLLFVGIVLSNKGVVAQFYKAIP